MLIKKVKLFTMKVLILILIFSSHIYAQSDSSNKAWSNNSIVNSTANISHIVNKSLQQNYDCSKQGSADRSTPKIKSWKDAHTYFDCYSKQKLSKTQLEITIVSAAHYGLNEIMMACLMLLESRFDSNARSGFAEGIAQFRPETMSYVKTLNKTPSIKTINRCRKTKKESEIGYCKLIEERVENAKSLQILADSLREKKLLKGRIKYETHDHFSPIVLSAMYMNRIIKTVRESTKNFDTNKSFFEKEMAIIKLSLAGYNMGPGKIYQEIRKTKKREKSFDDAILGVRSRAKESSLYIDGIERCMRHKVFEGPTETERYQKCPR